MWFPSVDLEAYACTRWVSSQQLAASHSDSHSSPTGIKPEPEERMWPCLLNNHYIYNRFQANSPTNSWVCNKSYWGSSTGVGYRSCNFMSQAHYLYKLICSEEEGLAPVGWIMYAGTLAYRLHSGTAPPTWTWSPLPGSSRWSAAGMFRAVGPSAGPALAPC